MGLMLMCDHSQRGVNADMWSEVERVNHACAVRSRAVPSLRRRDSFVVSAICFLSLSLPDANEFIVVSGK